MTAPQTRRLSMIQALNEALREEMQRDPKCMVIGEDIIPGGGLYGVTAGLYEEFGPRRVLDMPISEAGFCGFATGCAIAGAPVVVEIQILDFIMVALDQICNHAAKLHYMSGGQLQVPIVVRGPCATGLGLGAQHGQNLEGWFADMPGLYVVTPATADDAKGLLKASIRNPNPVVFIEHKLLYDSRSDVPADGDRVVPLGKAAVLREGTDVSIIANGLGVRAARRAIKPLREKGIDPELVDLRTVRPLDLDTVLASVEKTGRAVFVSGSWAAGGVASKVTQAIVESDVFDCLKAPVRTVGAADIPVPFARELERLSLPQPDLVVEQVVRAVGKAPAVA